jgi:hypothetical protein
MKHYFMKNIFLLAFFFLPFVAQAQYTGTASVTQGLATTTTTNLFTCTGGRVTNLGSIVAKDGTTWTVPAAVNFANSAFPFASDLNNACNGANYSSSTTALAALTGSDIVNVDAAGEVITAYIFADNYFEMYINGVFVGKDKVPFTQFNSSIVRFRVKRPFTIAMHLVDWEENLGLGSENNGGFSYHPGDGGVVAVFKDASNKIIAKTGSDWKAQTFYTAPITNLTCPTESGSSRLSNNCSTQDSNNGSSYYALHWSKPANWMNASFDDSSWPSAATFSNATIGVDNKPAYTNFTSIFDDSSNDAQFIWSSNVILDNEVVARYTVKSATALEDENESEIPQQHQGIRLYPNPSRQAFNIEMDSALPQKDVHSIRVFDLLGKQVFEAKQFVGEIATTHFPTGLYIVQIAFSDFQVVQKMVIQ